jgi:hypothetical protein
MSKGIGDTIAVAVSLVLVAAAFWAIRRWR